MIYCVNINTVAIYNFIYRFVGDVPMKFVGFRRRFSGSLGDSVVFKTPISKFLHMKWTLLSNHIDMVEPS